MSHGSKIIRKTLRGSTITTEAIVTFANCRKYTTSFRGRKAMDSSLDYTTWSNEQLVNRVTELEAQLKKQNAAYSSPGLPTTANLASRPSSPNRPVFKKEKKVANRTFDPSKYSSRFVAFKFAYLGQRYNGFEHAVGTLRLYRLSRKSFGRRS